MALLWLKQFLLNNFSPNCGQTGHQMLAIGDLDYKMHLANGWVLSVSSALGGMMGTLLTALIFCFPPGLLGLECRGFLLTTIGALLFGPRVLHQDRVRKPKGKGKGEAAEGGRKKKKGKGKGKVPGDQPRRAA